MDTTTKDLQTLTELLGLEEFEVVAVQRDATQTTASLVVAPIALAAGCPDCHVLCQKHHATHERRIRDLPLGCWATELIVVFYQFQCWQCHRFFTPSYRAIAAGTHATERFLERMTQMIGFSDITNTARFFGVPEKTLEAWYYQHLEHKKQAAAAQPLRSLGIDELSLKKNIGSSAGC